MSATNREGRADRELEARVRAVLDEQAADAPSGAHVLARARAVGEHGPARVVRDRRRWLVPVLAAAVVLASTAIGVAVRGPFEDSNGPVSPPDPTTSLPTAPDTPVRVGPPFRGVLPDDYDGDFVTSAGVLQDPDGTSRMCGIASDVQYLPGCGGPVVEGIPWSALDSQPAEAGGRFATLRFEARLEDGRLDVVGEVRNVPRRTVRDDSGYEEVADVSPCSGRELAAQPTDPSRITAAAMRSGLDVAVGVPGVTVAWQDTNDDATARPTQRPGQVSGRGAHRWILDVRTTGDPDAVVAAVREVWGGPVCVTGDDRLDFDALYDLQATLSQEGERYLTRDLLYDERRHRLLLESYAPTESMQDELNQRYGEGSVVLVRWLDAPELDSPAYPPDD
jgi:hypothetical protein